ncbi:calcium-transporting ATPase endoplasmic reticulum-type [Raphidocelis subcapitata]|uniref:Calcium-transporting ATPase n=1 Tax=Raphidocelis subcapitata TaxID=307507 RepID=A0A2V0PKR0_9CHLO|nr:calcium-transporting ATPase endoplasmic reticulum-type [Raphidocelis subcapitata]|eukprot:GBF97625.1 calcium-transporting ATPase endoplasmic reticulum-type [Raphidocelis subcapitata]
MMDNAHAVEVEEVFAFYGVDPSRGLGPFEVEQARARYGRNELPAEEGTPLWKLVLKQFDDLLVKILIAAAVVDFVIAWTGGDSFLSSLVEPMVIVLILVANATVGVVTERNAERAIEELKAYEAASAAALREGRLQQVAARDLVPGDIVELAAGDQVPADVRVAALLSGSFRADQSILTGESHPVAKEAGAVGVEKAVYQDKTNMLYSGTMIAAGRARCVVVATGTATAIGQIRGAMAQDEDTVTPLKQKLDEFGHLLSKVIAVICVLVWVMNFRRFSDPALGGWVKGAIYYFKIAVALAVAAIPEGLPAVVTTCLALGTRKMAQQNAIVRTLPSVETLGCTTVICSDKTGTLTTNQMSVVRAAVIQSPDGELAEFSLTGTTHSPEGRVLDARGAPLAAPSSQPALLQAAMCSSLCNDSAFSRRPDGDGYARVGESTEVALRVFTEKVGLPAGSLPLGDWPGPEVVCGPWWGARYARTGILEFTRDRKMMSVVVAGEGRSLLLTKGAPEAVLSRCATALLNGTGRPAPINDAARRAVLRRAALYGGAQALRCLALASKPLRAGAGPPSRGDESDLTFLGLVAMHDPPRRECAAALQMCREAGIRVVMVTGDSPATAAAVAREVGVLSGGGAGDDGDGVFTALTGAEFDALPEEQQAEAAASLAVFSRVEPLHKLRLVELLRRQGHVVAMTGDGVNDAPALVRADIGVAMGSGTAVAKRASDMVLADDNFATIVAAVREGRAIYANTKQFIRYMISSNIGEVVAIFLAALLGVPEVLTPVQLLWVNLVTDGLPATALGFNRAEKGAMTRPPRRMTEPTVNGWLFMRYLVIGIYVGVATAAGFLWWFLSAPTGPRVPFSVLSSFQTCDAASAAAWGLGGGCAVFSAAEPRTVAMSVLVVVEMFNALNNISEEASLLVVPPWDNRWLLGAIATSMALHCAILYSAPLAALFGIAPLTRAEWVAVVVLSAPVVLLDELMKAFLRASRRRPGGSGGGGLGGGGRGESGQRLLLPLGGIQVVGGGGGGGAAGDDKSH